MKIISLKTGLIAAAAGAVLIGAAALAAEPHGKHPFGPHMRRDFAELDANKDGQVDRAEFDRPAPDPFDAMDKDHNGTVSQAEFDAFKPDVVFFRGDPDGPPPGFGPRRRMGPPDLKALDANGDGKVSFDEFAAPMKDHFDHIDANHDGALSDDELKADGPPPMGR